MTRMIFKYVSMWKNVNVFYKKYVRGVLLDGLLPGLTPCISQYVYDFGNVKFSKILSTPQILPPHFCYSTENSSNSINVCGPLIIAEYTFSRT